MHNDLSLDAMHLMPGLRQQQQQQQQPCWTQPYRFRILNSHNCNQSSGDQFGLKTAISKR